MLATALAGVGEIQVLDRNGRAAAGPGEAEQVGDRFADAGVAGGGGQPGHLESDGVRLADRVARAVEDLGGQVAGVQVGRQHPVLPQLVESGTRRRREFP